MTVFELSLKGKSTHDISSSLGITPASVRTLRSRVRNRMIEEVKNIRTMTEL
ncbi:MAG: hypothetical protein HQL32_11985 [Planctomycetes bacterium]|nr:hypothetical protein [Planctomycetota bacterium]